MPNMMAALPNTGGALCSTPQSLADGMIIDYILRVTANHYVAPLHFSIHFLRVQRRCPLL